MLPQGKLRPGGAPPLRTAFPALASRHRRLSGLAGRGLNLVHVPRTEWWRLDNRCTDVGRANSGNAGQGNVARSRQQVLEQSLIFWAFAVRLTERTGNVHVLRAGTRSPPMVRPPRRRRGSRRARIVTPRARPLPPKACPPGCLVSKNAIPK